MVDFVLSTFPILLEFEPFRTTCMFLVAVSSVVVVINIAKI